MIDWETLQFPRHVHTPSIPPDWVWKRVETLEECQQALEEGWMLHASIATEAPVESEIAAEEPVKRKPGRPRKVAV